MTPLEYRIASGQIVIGYNSDWDYQQKEWLEHPSSWAEFLDDRGELLGIIEYNTAYCEPVFDDPVTIGELLDNGFQSALREAVKSDRDCRALVRDVSEELMTILHMALEDEEYDTHEWDAKYNEIMREYDQQNRLEIAPLTFIDSDTNEVVG